MNPCGIHIKSSTLTHVNNIPWILTPKCLFMQNLHHWWARCMILLWDKITQSCSLTFPNFVCFISLQTYPWQRYCDAQIQNGRLHCSSCSTQLNQKKKRVCNPSSLKFLRELDPITKPPWLSCSNSSHYSNFSSQLFESVNESMPSPLNGA